MPRLGSVGRQREHLVPRHDVADGPVQVARSTCDQRGPLRHEPLPAERAAHERIDDANIRWVDAHHRRRAIGELDDELARLVDRQLAVRPGRGRRVELDRVLVLGRRAVIPFDPDGRCGEGGVEVPRLLLLLVQRLGMRDVHAGAVHRRGGRLSRVSHQDAVRRVARDLVGLGHHHRDDLAVVADFGAGEWHVGVGRVAPLLGVGRGDPGWRVPVGVHLDDPGQRLGGGGRRATAGGRARCRSSGSRRAAAPAPPHRRNRPAGP